MKNISTKILFIILIIFSAEINIKVLAQGITIGSGTALSLGGSTLYLPGNWNNNGTFNAGTGTVVFNGTNNQTISNASGETFYNLTVNKSSDTVQLENNITVSGTLTFTSGLISTGSDTVTLGSTATISEVIGSEVMGNLTTSRTLSQSVNNTFGGIGVEINAASAAPGITTVTRVTGTAETANSNSSIKRYFDITPATDAGLNATLVFHYDPATELNGITESDLILFKSIDNGNTWTQMNGTVNTTNHDIALTGVDSFSRWTAAGSSSPLPVELTTFTAASTGSASSPTGSAAVELNWQTETEVNDYGFEIQRTLLNPPFIKGGTEGGWEKIGFVKGSGNSNSPKSYSFVDDNPISGKVEYRLKQIDNDGGFKYSSIVEASFMKPANFALEQNYPNPFNPSTTIQYSIPKAEHVTLKVYDEIGREVTTLVNDNKEAGSYNVTFNASKLASGIYFYRISAGKFNEIKKLVLLK